MTDTVYFSTMATSSRIDGGRGVIYGVSVITAGQAEGANAGTYIDSTTIDQIAAVGNASGDGIPVKLSMRDEHDGSVGQYVARLINFRRDGDKCRADLELLSTMHKQREFVLELAQKMPSRFGLSVAMPTKMEKIKGKNYLRCDDLFSVDLVEAPAANKGLFSAKPATNTHKMSEIKYKHGDSGEHHETCECKECMSEMAAHKAHKKMSALLSSIYTGKADSTEAEIAAAVTKLSATGAAPAPAPAAGTKSAAEIKLAEIEAELARVKVEADKRIALSAKAEIDSIVAEATKLGKVVPFENADLYTEKDGVVTICTSPERLRTVLSKIPAGTVKTATSTGAAGNGDVTKLDVWDTSPEAASAWKAAKEQAHKIGLSRFTKK